MISPIRREAHSFSTKPFDSSADRSTSVVGNENDRFSPATDPVRVTFTGPPYLYRPTHTSCSPWNRSVSCRGYVREIGVAEPAGIARSNSKLTARSVISGEPILAYKADTWASMF